MIRAIEQLITISPKNTYNVYVYRPDIPAGSADFALITAIFDNLIYIFPVK